MPEIIRPSESDSGSVPRPRPVAIVDIGSNSVRLVAYEGLSRALTPTYNEKVMCGLGRNVPSTGRLDDRATGRALKALVRFRTLCDMLEVAQVRVIATAAARDASNGPAFLEEAAAILGRPVELLSGAREAQLSALGVISGVHGADGIVGDLGGGSLELIEVSGRETGEGVTTPLGGLALQDLSGDNPKKAQKIVRDTLARVGQLADLKGRTFYAVGGTWRALARLHMATRNYPLRVMHGYRIEPQDGLDFLDLVERSDAATLKEIDEISDARRPLLVYGAIVLEEILRVGRPKSVTISALGVREGLLFEELTPEQQAADPLLTEARHFNGLRSRSPRHGEELVAWTDRFFDGLALSEAPEERRLRHAACLLADIAWRAHPDYRGEQSFSLIANAAFVGVDHPGRIYLALANFFRHEGLNLDKVPAHLRTLATPRLLDLSRLLAAALRVAYPVSAAMGDVLPRAPLVMEGDGVTLRLPSDLGGLSGERLVGRMKQLAKIVGGEPRILIG